MEPVTYLLPDGTPAIRPTALQPSADGYTGEAAERLARFERFAADIAADQQNLAQRLEQLRAAGKKNSAQFRESLGKKLTNGAILALLKTYGLE